MSFLKFSSGRVRAVGYAFKGMVALIRREPSVKVQVFLTVLVIAAGFYFEITATQWMFQLLAAGLVLSAEGLNSAVEAIADFIHPDYHLKIGHIKDIAAGAVFFAAIFSTIIGLIIYVPYILALFD
ncbi:diacylglycerol kinase family protein [Nonlabens ponticola]|uniref:Diacylglycerol kinase family protein n=1 Tax=Nonlabens ponticola TaxID=2496866 RepID=A0A3S9MZJ1_9FLAO|nr:diacylglycerol kinase family protein [Nonlabens ponticola]AZQ44671.1 diacylglycerol kinase family protein [Nonlabens ponticola]